MKLPHPGLVLSAVGAISVLSALHLIGAVELDRYLGASAPIAVGVFVLIGGVVSLQYLQRAEGFQVISSGARLSGLRLALGLVVPFALGITAIDLLYPFPQDINVPLPTALAFYPAIGFLAQIALHIIPFAVLVGLGRFVSRGRVAGWWIWVALLTASSVEAIFQAAGAKGAPLFVVIYVAVSLFLFGMVELVLYRRYDFLTMFSFRMFYYLYWHIGWGGLRLELLFPGQ